MAPRQTKPTWGRGRIVAPLFSRRTLVRGFDNPGLGRGQWPSSRSGDRRAGASVAGSRHRRRARRACATARFAGAKPQGGLWVYLETIGFGARAGKNGDGVHVHMTNISNLPVEPLEVEYPLTVLRYEPVDGSGGAGPRPIASRGSTGSGGSPLPGGGQRRSRRVRRL